MLNGDKTTQKILNRSFAFFGGGGGSIEVGVLGLKNGRAWRWSVCHSNAGAIEVKAIEVGVLGLNNGRGWRWNV